MKKPARPDPNTSHLTGEYFVAAELSRPGWAGRVMAVEYKGKYLYDAPDAEEKRLVGKVWESRSAGKCLFAMPTQNDFSEITKIVSPQ